MKCAVVIYSPKGYAHNECFREVAEAVYYGLLELGHDAVLYASDHFPPGRRCIIFGSNYMKPEQLKALPLDAIIFNLEQCDSKWWTPNLVAAFKKREVWDYSPINVRRHKILGAPNVKLVPIGHVSELERIKPVVPDIDVLFYGSMNTRRKQIWESLPKSWKKVHLMGVYGRDRDLQIARAKIVLNMHYYKDTSPLEIVRLMYLLGNKKFVISEPSPDGDEFENGIMFVEQRKIVQACEDALGDEMLRERVAAEGYRIAVRRRQSDYLHSALTSNGANGKANTALLGLTMIVKNEAKHIRDTLNGIAPYIDRWCILDTGSTDGTQEIIRDTLKDIPGELFEEPFVDFSTSRNRAIELAGKHTEYLISLDTDDKLLGGPQLRDFLADGTAHANAYQMSVSYADYSYPTVRIMRTGAGWTFHGQVHEALTSPNGDVAWKLPETILIQHAQRNKAATEARWQQDLHVLLAARVSDPTDTRTVFYLAQTYQCLRMFDKALETYAIRVALGGSPLETYEAKYRLAMVAYEMRKPWLEVQQLYLEAYSFSPDRAEPLFAIAFHYHQKKSYVLAKAFAQLAAVIPRPRIGICIQTDVYEYKARQLAEAIDVAAS